VTDTALQTQGALFQAVQLARLFDDSKTFPDSVPLAPPERIEAEFRTLLDGFVRARFALPEEGRAVALPRTDGLAAHIDAMWTALTRASRCWGCRPRAGSIWSTAWCATSPG
jgi:alpha,alpha-trehalase